LCPSLDNLIVVTGSIMTFMWVDHIMSMSSLIGTIYLIAFFF
jgi:hypothetical protein